VRLIGKMMKRKTVYRFLVPILVVGMVVYPFAATERAEASTSVTNVWVELSDDTALNTTSTDLEYIIHFTTTTALTGGVDTITLTFPDGTVAMGAPAGQEGSGYAGRGGGYWIYMQNPATLAGFTITPIQPSL